MQHFRKISSLEEDFEAMGIARKQPAGQFFASEQPNSAPDLTEDLDEGLSVQRTHKMSPADRAQARRYRQRNKSKLHRQKTVRERKPQHKVRKARVDRLKGARTAGPRRRFVLNQDMTDMRNQMKALTELRKFHNANSPKTSPQLMETLKRISANAQLLCRKFAVLEEIKSGQLKESGIPIEHPESEYGWENPDAPNINPANKEGDPTDYASNSKLKGNVKAEGDAEPGDNQDWWVDVDSSGDDLDDMADVDVSVDADDGEVELDFDLPDEDDGEEEIPMEGRIDLSYEMAKLRTEAEDVLAKMKTSVLSPEAASAIVRDMVTYLGGAMKAYLDLSTEISGEYNQAGYAGQGAPEDVGAGPDTENGQPKKYVGKDEPADAGVSPEIYKLNV